MNNIKNFEMLNESQKQEIATIKQSDFLNYLQRNPISCVGCNFKINQLIKQIFFNPKSNEVFDKNQNFSVKKNTIILRKEIFENKNRFATTINQFLLKNQLEDSCDKCYNFSTIQQGIQKKSKKDRCLLHSNKIIPHSMWITCIKSLLSSNQDLQKICQFEESFFMHNLQSHIKNRKFCSTCKQNILAVYKNLKQTNILKGNQNQEDDKEINSEDSLERPLSEDNKRIKSENKFLYRQRYKSLDIINSQEIQSIYKDQESQNRKQDDSQSQTSTPEMINYLTYDQKKRTLNIPAYSNIILKLLQKVQQKKLFLKHASTCELAQEQVLICLGNILKQRLQKYWKQKQSKQTVFKLLTFISVMILIQNFTTKIEQKKYYNKKSSLEVGCANQQLQQQKMKKKSQKRKQLKKKKKKAKKQSLKSQEIKIQENEQQQQKSEKQMMNTNENNFSKQQKQFLFRLGWHESSQKLDYFPEQKLRQLAKNKQQIRQLRKKQRQKIQAQFNCYLQKL